MRRILPLLLGVVLMAGGSLSGVIEVTNTADSGPGSLRDAIERANANPGADVIAFHISPDDPGFSGQWWTITLQSALPALSDDATHILAFTQSENRGDHNPGRVGTGGTVGVDRIPLPEYRRPEVAIDAAGFDGLTIDGAASDILIEGLAIYGAASGIVAEGFEPGGDRTSPGTNRRIIESLIGVAPDGSDPGARRIAENGIVVRASAEGAPPTELDVERCFVGYSGQVGIVGVRGASTLRVSFSEVFANGWATNDHDGIDANGVDGELVANLSRDNTNASGTPFTGSGAGIEAGSSLEGAGHHRIENNTVQDNLGAGIAVRAGSSGNVVRKNVATRNAAGIVVSEEDGPATDRNVLTQNSTFENRGLGIDLHTGDVELPFDGVTLNSPMSRSSGSNNLQPYPVITGAALADGRLIVSGFSTEGASIEFFLADDDETRFGEGRVHLFTAIESSELDEDSESGAYGPELQGFGPVATESLEASAFRFDTPSNVVADLPGGDDGQTWRITATETVQDNTSEFGPSVPLLRLPDRVTLIGPADGTERFDTPLLLSWVPSGGALTYEIHLSKASDIGSVADSALGLTGTTYSFDRAVPGTTYFWRVRGVNGNGVGAWSDVWSFSFSPITAPEKVILLKPQAGITNVSVNPRFEWEASPGAERYELEVTGVPPTGVGAFRAPVISVTTDTRSVEGFSLEEDSIYYWHVRGTRAGRPGPWSDVWSFSTGDSTPPPFIVLLTPPDGAVGVPPVTEFEWFVSDSAAYHVIEITTDPPGGDGPFDTTVHRRPLDRPRDAVKLAPGSDYYWQVLVVSPDRDSVWSPVGTFLTGPGESLPGQVTLRSPADGSSGVPLDAPFEWFEARAAEKYVFELYRTDDGVVSRIDTGETGETAYSYSMTPVADSLSWRVRAQSAKGPGAWSRTFRFSTKPDPRGCLVNLLQPAPGSVDVSTLTSFSWSSTPSPDIFRLEIVDAEADTAVVSTTVADSAYSPEIPLVNGKTYDWRVRCESPRGVGDYAQASFVTIRYRGEFFEPAGKTQLVHNRPNPFNARTTIRFELEEASPVELSLFDVRGQRLAVLVSGHLQAGPHEVVWDGSLASGGAAPSGLYLYRLVAGGFAEIRSMTLLK